MSETITLTLRTSPDERAEVEGLTADRLAELSAVEIAALPIWIGSKRASIGDFFAVNGEHSSTVRIEGDLHAIDGVGAAMAGGELLIAGNAGHRVGAGMTGGWVDVRGNAGDDAGVGMQGGALRVTGDAGDRAGAAAPGAAKGMTGGELIVNGSVGHEAGARARRGLIVAGGNAGDDGARSMIAGTLVVFGRTGARPGRGSKRGSIVAIGGIDVPVTYEYACTYQPVYVRMLLTYLYRRYGLAADDAVLDGRFARYCGDGIVPGKAEILVYTRGDSGS